jgi:hypothetical protein
MRLPRLVVGCVVETTGFNDRTWLDFAGHPHSEALHVTERFRRTNFGSMQLDITYTDPKTYTKPFSVKLPVFYQADTEGSYDVGPLGTWQVVLDGDELKIQMAPDAPRLPLFAVSDTQFVFQSLGGQVRFVPDAAGVATQLILTIVEGDIPAMRK